jgi:hypothetical protein
MNVLPNACVTCGDDGAYTVLLAVGLSMDNDYARYFIPNQHAREAQGSGMDPIHQVTFCQTCMREIEDGMRGTIARLQQENGVTPMHRSHYD